MFQGFYAKQLSKIGLSENIIGVLTIKVKIPLEFVIAGYFLRDFDYILFILFFFTYFEVIIEKDNFL